MPRSKALMKKRAGAGTGSKKIVIKPFSKPPTLPANYYETTSQALLQGTLDVCFLRDSKSNALSLQNSYQQVVNLVSHQYGPRLYQDLVAHFRLACQEHVLTKTESESLLSYVQSQYQSYVDYLLLCKHVFLPLDRTHTWTADGQVWKRSSASASNGNHPVESATSNTQMGLWQVGLEQFRLRLESLEEEIYQTWWKSLQLDWQGQLPLDQLGLLQQTVYMWQDLGILQQIITQKLEPDLIQFFQSESQAWKGGEPYQASSVIQFCHSKWMQVAHSWSRFLPKQICVHLLEKYLFQPHLQSEWLLQPAHFDPLIEEATGPPSTPSRTSTTAVAPGSNAPTTIQQLWMLAGRLPGGYKLVGGAIAQYAKSRGLALMTNLGDAQAGKQKIGDLLALQQQLQQLLAQLPKSSDYCALKNVWEDVVNPASDGSDTNLVAEALAKYADSYLKDAKKQNPDSQWSTHLISGIFCYLQAKDVFEAFYKRDLAKRLLWNRVVSMDVERNFVSLLKAECGAGYTAKMEGMFQDMDWSRETMTRYKQTAFAANDSSNDSLDVDIQVLTTGYWPVYPQYPNLILPQALLDKQEHFAEYYKTKYQGRRMSWQYALGNVNVRFRPDSGRPYDLILTLCHALVLLQFNEKEEWKLPQLMAAVGLEDRDEMERILQSMSVGKEGTRILIKQDHDADESKRKKPRMSVHDEDTFRIQNNFKSNQRRIRIFNILVKESKEERDKTVEAVSRDRLYLIDAVLVRIMKARKTILHQQLIPQVMEQVKVPAQPADIKKRIESLIEREYMERDSKDRSRYNYLA